MPVIQDGEYFKTNIKVRKGLWGRVRTLGFLTGEPVHLIIERALTREIAEYREKNGDFLADGGSQAGGGILGPPKGKK